MRPTPWCRPHGPMTGKTRTAGRFQSRPPAVQHSYGRLPTRQLLNYINSNTQFHAANTAMCSQGASAGGAAVAYSIVWYGLGSKLNNVELAAGPTLSDIKIGCQYPRYGNVNICAGTQLGCSPATTAEANSMNGPLWVDDAEYIANYLRPCKPGRATYSRRATTAANPPPPTTLSGKHKAS